MSFSSVLRLKTSGDEVSSRAETDKDGDCNVCDGRVAPALCVSPDTLRPGALPFQSASLKAVPLLSVNEFPLPVYF